MLIATNPVRIPELLQVFVRNERGIASQYEVDPYETVDQLKYKIYKRERVLVDQQRIIYNGRQLEGGKMLQDYNITHKSTIDMALRLL